MGFDREEDFRSNFKEDRKSNEAPKTCRKQGEAVRDLFFSPTYLSSLHFWGMARLLLRAL